MVKAKKFGPMAQRIIKANTRKVNTDQRACTNLVKVARMRVNSRMVNSKVKVNCRMMPRQCVTKVNGSRIKCTGMESISGMTVGDSRVAILTIKKMVLELTCGLTAEFTMACGKTVTSMVKER